MIAPLPTWSHGGGAEHVDERPVAVGDASPSFLGVDLTAIVGEYGFGPDAPTDGEAGVLAGRCRRQPAVDRLDPRTGAENHHSCVVATVAERVAAMAAQPAGSATPSTFHTSAATPASWICVIASTTRRGRTTSSSSSLLHSARSAAE